MLVFLLCTINGKVNLLNCFVVCYILELFMRILNNGRLVSFGV